jgi:hypothetical protein
MFEGLVTAIGWGTPVGIGFFIACLGIFFFCLGKFVSSLNKTKK